MKGLSEACLGWGLKFNPKKGGILQDKQVISIQKDNNNLERRIY